MTDLNNKKLLMVSKDLSDISKGGREQLSRINQRIIQEIFQDNLYLFDTSPKKIDSWIKKFYALRGFIDGLSKNKCYEILRTIDENNIKQVYIDGSNFGKLVQFLKIKNPNIKIISFFHNVEAKFFFDGFMKKKSLRSFFIFIANYVAERLAVKYSDTIISLSERDSSFLLKIYGRASDKISPLIINRPQKESPKTNLPKGNFFIFVGGAFYANIHGIRWFIKNVMPEMDEDLYIIGKGFEKYKLEFEELSNVHVIGFVEFLSDWYEAAKFVVAPIFEGSGMKTKVAESLMFGKILIGTPEAFSGYEAVKSIAGIECSSRDEFIHAIKNKSFIGSDSQRRRAYEELYSFQAGKIRMESILSE